MNEPKFDRKFVMNATSRRMLNNINFSIAKTVRKIKLFENSQDKSLEILMTLSELQELKAAVEKILKNNPYEVIQNDDDI